MRFAPIALLLCSSAFLSCEKPGDSDQLIFGHFYGLCAGETCIETFSLTEKKLYEDQADDYSRGSYDFKELSKEKFEIADGLREMVPQFLLNSDSQTFGCPDCVDQGGLVIEIYDDGEVKKFRIDQSKSSIPIELHNFVDEVNQRIAALQ